MEQNRALILLIILIFLFFPSFPGSDHNLDTNGTIAQERYQLEVLRNSKWESPGNLTGLLSGEKTPPEVVREKWRGIREDLVGHSSRGVVVYRNATGSVSGSWCKLSFPELPTIRLPNVTYPNNFSTINTGKVTVNVEDMTQGFSLGVGVVKVSLRLGDNDGGNAVDFAALGVHFERQGLIVATTTSERYSGFFAVPHFMLDEAEFIQSKQLLLPLIEKEVKKMEETHYMDAMWLPGAGGMPTSTKPQCEYIVYLQLHPAQVLQDGRYNHQLGLDNAGLLREIEREMRFPTGISLPPPPPMEIAAMIYSPNCGTVMLAEGLEGEKVEQFYTKASRFALAAAAVAGVQMWLLIRQMNESNTLTTICRVSFWTITMMAVVDGYLFFSFMIIALFLKACFLNMVAASFCYLMLSAVLGMRFMVTTYKVHRQWRQPTSAVSQAPTPATTDNLPAPATSGVSTPVIIPGNQDSPVVSDAEVDAELGALHTRFYFTLLAILFFTLNAATWPPFFRNIVLCIVFLVVNSQWVPQIYRNVMRGCRKAFQWEFVFGTSVCRLAGVFYIFLYPKNIFHAEPNPKAAALIIGLVWVQCVVLVCQDLFGPRFLLPSHLLPPVYDYHPPLPADDEEAAQNTGTAIGGGGGGGGRRSYDCVICMQSIEVPTAGSTDGRDGDGGSSVGLLGRRQYMVTPCRHVFHSHCLEGWMRFRLQCPICRNRLPAL
ncbi:hypothetical protein FN846DRAFT_925246 [Sphaerosporella brunnea]|uniref:DSC E3 ubiquitin ligase complex subunit A n=1 Tax=Sphaerosporella brunnea TaxID=1250544 RepID=A0A5J5FBD0_9PEZI|nr:hypothetical protein FN846DRAFT_925246 [Sphaerosporella brunnea]